MLTIPDSKRTGLYMVFLFVFGLFVFFSFFPLNLINKQDTINELTGIIIFLI